MTNSIVFLRQCFYALLVRPFLVFALGLNVHHRDRLVIDGTRIIAANHNSHLDAMVLMSLLRLRDIPKVKLVAAKDYFCYTPLRAWLSLNIIGVIPIDRQSGGSEALAPVYEALNQGYTVILFPEGTRGEAEKMQPLKFGVAKVLETHPHLSVTPVFMHGLGKSLPRGDALLVPFVCKINIGEPLSWNGEKAAFMTTLEKSFTALAAELAPSSWA